MSLSLPPFVGHTVNLSVIDTTRLVFPAEQELQPIVPGNTVLYFPSFSFLIQSEHTGQSVLWDLGVPKNHEAIYPPDILAHVEGVGINFTVTADVSEVLTKNGIALKSINSIFWSHHHFDHWGNPALFPPSTDLVVGPGFEADFLPGYPTNQSGQVPDSAFAGRTVRELDFNTTDVIQIGQFAALDYWKDGSFFILKAPGHTSDHMVALVRTTSDSFVLLAADSGHNSGEYRPTKQIPLPHTLFPCPRDPVRSHSSCPGEPYVAINPHNSSTTPFYNVSLEPSLYDNPAQAAVTLKGIEVFDAHEDVFVVIAHDGFLLDVIDFFPNATLNKWKTKDWKKLGRWRFLGNFTVDA
ncbi:metallo-beta-lactamase superfamily protein [Gloeopeniophorella convolvens]|nr:metallo-beta-lactamase superfamily protein [Gloeopeniophorella convolvens]